MEEEANRLGAEIYNPRIYIHLVPRNPDLLEDQPFHRSQSVWAADPEELNVINHRGTSALPPWDVRIEPFIERAGLARARFFRRMELDNNLLTTLIERRRRETHTFHLLEGEATITLKDIALLTDLPINGEAIIGSSKKLQGGWGPFILAHLGTEVPTVAEVDHKQPLDKSMLPIPWLVNHVGALGENATEEQVGRYARVYLIRLVGGVLFPDKSNRYMHCMWLPLLLGDWDDMGRKNWGSACMATLYAEVCKCTDPNTKQASGAMFIVQLWA